MKLVEIGFLIDFSSSFLSFVLFRLEEIIVVVREDLLILVENINNVGVFEEIKIVIFVCDNDRFVKVIKWRVNKVYNNELVVKCIEYIFICLVGLWFI